MCDGPFSAAHFRAGDRIRFPHAEPEHGEGYPGREGPAGGAPAGDQRLFPGIEIPHRGTGPPHPGALFPGDRIRVYR